MSLELILGALGLIFGLLGGGFGWSQIRKHGATKREVETLREQVNDYAEAIDAVLAANPTLDELDRVSKRASTPQDT